MVSPKFVARSGEAIHARTVAFTLNTYLLVLRAQSSAKRSSLSLDTLTHQLGSSPELMSVDRETVA